MTDPRPAPYAAPAPVPGSSNLGTVALVLAIVVAVLGVLSQAFSQFLPFAGLEIVTIGVIFSVLSIVSGIVGVVALIVGLIAARRPGERLVFAGIGIGVGGLAVLTTLLGLAFGLASFAV